MLLRIVFLLFGVGLCCCACGGDGLVPGGGVEVPGGIVEEAVAPGDEAPVVVVEGLVVVACGDPGDDGGDCGMLEWLMVASCTGLL